MYACVVETAAPVDAAALDAACARVRELRVAQRTPMRVSHRRAIATREKTMHFAAAAPVSPTAFALFLESSSGAYIKEFVTSDWGRTRPSFSELVGRVPCRVVQLDVLAVDLAGTGLAGLRDRVAELAATPLHVLRDLAGEGEERALRLVGADAAAGRRDLGGADHAARDASAVVGDGGSS